MASKKRDFVPRRRLTPEQRQQVLARYHQSRLTQRAFCAQEGVGLSTLIKWLHEERATSKSAVEFQEIILPGTGVTPPWAVEIVTPQGWIVRCQSEPDGKRLGQLLGALPC